MLFLNGEDFSFDEPKMIKIKKERKEIENVSRIK